MPTSSIEQAAALAFGWLVFKEAMSLIKFVLQYVRTRPGKGGSVDCEHPPAADCLCRSAPIWQTIIGLNAATHSQIDELRKEMNDRFHDIEARMDAKEVGY